MKRYRLTGFSYDSRPNDLSEQTKQDYINEFGIMNFDFKLQNIIDIGNMPMSVFAFHNIFFDDCRNAFIIGSYYPALTGACALGERILNHLIILLKEDYKDKEEYKKVYRKDSIDDWNLMITALYSWGVLLDDVKNDFLKLLEIRNKSIHFRPEVDTNDRAFALEVLILLQKIVGNQFSAIGKQPWFIRPIKGEVYIKKEWEDNPFIKKVYLPNSILVGPNHDVTDITVNPWMIDDEEYENIEITDDDFLRLRDLYRNKLHNN